VDETLAAVIEAAREATCDTHDIPACVELGRALYAYDKARGAICPTCDGSGLDHRGGHGDEGDDECGGPCNGTGLVEPPGLAPPTLDEINAHVDPSVVAPMNATGAEELADESTSWCKSDEALVRHTRDVRREALAGVRRVVNELRSKWYSEEGRASLALIAAELDREMAR
jgi:hypothetical protein